MTCTHRSTLHVWQDADIVMLVFSLTDRSSADEISERLDACRVLRKKQQAKSAKYMLVATKADAVHQWQIGMSERKQLIERWDLPIVALSSRCDFQHGAEGNSACEGCEKQECMRESGTTTLMNCLIELHNET